MIDLPDPLETELSSLMPFELSAKSRLRIAERLSSPDSALSSAGKSSNRRRLIRQMAFAGSLAAACLIAVVFWWQGRKPIDPAPQIVKEAKSVEVESEQRTLLAYHHALSSSSENLDVEFSSFSWPLPEATPRRIASAIPDDLLD